MPKSLSQVTEKPGRKILRASKMLCIMLIGVFGVSACTTAPDGTEPQVQERTTPENLPVISGPRTASGPSADQAARAQIPLSSALPQGTFGEDDTTIIQGIDDGKTRVALLLPLSGPNGAVGKAMLNAAQLALFDFAGDDFQLLTHDTRGTPEGAVDAVKLALGDGAKMIVGPLLASSVRAATPLATANNVPLVAFSSDRTVATPNVFTMGFLPGDQIKRVVRFARSRGLGRFAALAPQNAYGQAVIAAYRTAVLETGGELVDVRFYNPAAAVYDDIVKSLADYENRRAALLAQREELEKRSDEVSKRALKRLERLQTIGDLPFDTLLVADGGARLQAVSALLPFYDIDPAKIRVLGTGQWDVDGIGAEPALVGAWYAAPDPKARTDFETQYEAVYGSAPPRIATLAYDAVALSSVLGAANPGGAIAPSILANPSGFSGRDGVFRFLPSGLSERGLAVLQVQQRQNRVIDPAPRSFEALAN